MSNLRSAPVDLQRRPSLLPFGGARRPFSFSTAEPKPITEIIPHRPPILMVDSYETFEIPTPPRKVGKVEKPRPPKLCVTAWKELKETDAVWEGKGMDLNFFPEFMAQSTGPLIVAEGLGDQVPLFAGVEDLNIVPTQLRPGDTIQAKVLLDLKMGPMRSFIGEVKLGDEVIANCKFDIVIAPASAIPQWKESEEYIGPSYRESRDLMDLLSLSRTQLFVDHVDQIGLRTRQIHAGYTHPLSHPINQGHYPGNPIFMGIKQVTAARQALQLFASVASGSGVAGFEDMTRTIGIGLSKVEWRSVVRSGDRIDIRVSNIKIEGELITADAELSKEDSQVASVITGLKIKKI